MVCPPSGGVECRGACAVTLLLLPALQKWHLGFGGQFFFFFGLFLSFGPEFACVCTQLFVVPYSFFVFCSSRRGVSRCKHCSTEAEGPRPVSD